MRFYNTRHRRPFKIVKRIHYGLWATIRDLICWQIYNMIELTSRHNDSSKIALIDRDPKLP